MDGPDGADSITSLLARHADDAVCRLVTVGRRSGRPHDIEIWFGVVGDELAFISGNGPSADWYRNALANPAVEVRLGGRWLAGTARDAVGEERRRVGEVMGRKHRGWGGDADIGLTEPAWVWEVPALLVGDLRLRGS